ncbi:hypothetical protein K7432_010731 [Basidiobolus ranarum]|uniref:WHIM2 domain-containing protein n=1 Tax=Basidiobolus ranarum TaxID=34480 RepID=A0ABR2WN78_9FUNG
MSKVKGMIEKRPDLRDCLQPGVLKLPPISDDLDPILLLHSTPLPKFEELNIPNDGLHLMMDEWAQLMMAHDFFCKFSSDVLNMKTEDYSYKILEDLICNTATINKDGLRLICNLIEFIESEEDYQDSLQLPSVNPVNFQWYIGEILPEKSNAFATTEFPNILPRDRLRALSYLIDLAMDTDQFSQYLHTGVDERMSQLRREKRERTDIRRQLENQIADLTRNIQAIEKCVTDTQEELKRLARVRSSDDEGDEGVDNESPSVSFDEGTYEVPEKQEKQKQHDKRTPRQKILAEEMSRKKLVATLKGKCTKLAKDSEKLTRQRENKRKSISDLSTKDLSYQSQVESISSKYRGGIVPSRGIDPTSQEILLIGYDRYARAYWHWKPIGGILIEEHQYPEAVEYPLDSSKREVDNSFQIDGHTTKAQKVMYNHRSPITKWYYMDDSRQLLLLLRPLNSRGIREKSLRSMLTSMRPQFINSLERFRSWLSREIGQSYNQISTMPASNAVPTDSSKDSNMQLFSPAIILPKAEATKSQADNLELASPNQTLPVNANTPLNTAIEEDLQKPNSIEPIVFIQDLKNTIHKQIEQLTSILSSILENVQLPKIEIDSTVAEHLSYIKLLFTQVNEIEDGDLSKLPVDIEKRARWLRTTNFQEDFDDNICTFSSLNVNIDMCIRDIEGYKPPIEKLAEEVTDFSNTKLERQVNLRDRKSRKKVIIEEANNSETENEATSKTKPTRRSKRVIADDQESDTEDKLPISSIDKSPPSNKRHSLRTRNSTRHKPIDIEEAEAEINHASSRVTRQTRSNTSKRVCDEVNDNGETKPQRKLRTRKSAS